MTDGEGAPGRRLALIVVGSVAIAVAIVVGTVAAVAGDGQHGGRVAVPALELASVSSEVAGHYHAAADLSDVYREVPCYCGCEEFLGHRHLYDCFVRADGAGWEAHAAGCGVCLAESALVRELTDAGTPTDDVRTSVIARFGTTPTTAPPT